jgi:ATP-dependent exoDNAse (exonuclease V) alpha subunit
VIQKYTFSSDIPEEQNIIVDEIGMVAVAGWNMLVRCKIAGKNIMVYGDNGQLAPVESRLCDSKNFYNLMFKNHEKLDKNYRNNFTKEYYNELKQTNKMVCDNVEYFREKRLNEVLKHNTPYDKADVIIAYTHKTREKYNKLMCKKLGIKTIGDNGAKIMCKSNDLRELNIYNNFCYDVINNGNSIILNDGVDKIELEPKFLKYFDYAYARTLHSVQGQTLKSFHYCIEDIKFLGGREIYTLISRLKQEKVEIKNPVIKKVEIKKKIIKKATTKHSLFNAWLDKKNGL